MRETFYANNPHFQRSLRIDWLGSRGVFHAPVHVLPTELLGRIFILCVPTREIYGRNDVKRATAVSHVCRRWRVIALGTPQLWSVLLLSDEGCGEEMLARSKGIGLVVNVDIEHQSEPKLELLQRVLGHMSRIVVLRLRMRLEHLQVLRTQVAQYAPDLRSLKLDPLLDNPNADPEEVDRLALPVALFLNEYPCLRHVHLSRCIAIKWDAPIFSALVSLQLEDIPRSALPNMTGLLDVLRRMPNLKILTLGHAIPTAGHLAHPGDAEEELPDLNVRPVILPHLACIDLCDDIGDVWCLCRYLVYPPAATNRVTAYITAAEHSLIAEDLLFLLQEQYSVRGARPFSTMSLDLSGDSVGIVQWWESPVLPDIQDKEPRKDEKCHTKVLLYWQNGLPPMSAVSNMWGAIARDEIQTFLYSTDDPVINRGVLWKLILEHCPLIETFVISGVDAATLIPALGVENGPLLAELAAAIPGPNLHPEGTTVGDAVRKLALPKLGTLIFRNVDFREEVNGNRLGAVLARVLLERAAAGNKLEKLEIWWSSVLDENDMMQIQEAAGDVQYHGLGSKMPPRDDHADLDFESETDVDLGAYY